MHGSLVQFPGKDSTPLAARGTLLRVLAPVAYEDATSVGESGFLAVRDPNLTILYLNKVTPDREIRYNLDISVPRQTHQVSSGLVLLITLTEEVIEDCATALPQDAGRSLLPDVWATAAGGYAVARPEPSKGQLAPPRLR